MKEMVLANLIMISEIPAPTFGEEPRVHFLRDRFSECDLQNVSTDEAGNVAGLVPGSGETNKNILLVGHTDTVFDEKSDHTINMTEDRATGRGVGDNSLGVAALASLPTLLENLGIKLKSNLLLMGSVKSLGRGDLEGIRFFLDNTKVPINAGICVEGVQLGRLSYAALGMVRGEITVEVPEEYDWSRFSASGAIRIINDVINHINAIALPNEPRTSILLGSVSSGSSFNTAPTQAELRFEIRSESAEMVERVRGLVEQIAEEVTSERDATISLDIFAQRKPGGVGFGHPLIWNTRRIMKALEVNPRIAPSISELASFIYHDIPAITLGISTGENLHKKNESVAIDPMFTGLAQLVAVLIAIDEGLCDED